MMRNTLEKQWRYKPPDIFLYRLKNKNILFWILNVAYWMMYWFYICLIHASVRHFPPKVILWSFLIATTGFALSFFLRAVYKHLRLRPFRLISFLLIILLVTSFTANVWYGLDLLLDQFMKNPNLPAAPVTWGNYLAYTFYWQLLLLAWSIFYFVMKFWMAWTHQRNRTQKAILLAKRSQLQMLRYQLNPHFLFNALNSVRALVDEDEENARAMITELSEFLRYSLIGKEKDVIPFIHEIKAIRHYFAIEKKRYEHKLDVAFEIDPQAENFPVIPFLIHPLVENAVKYGMKTSAMPLQIRIDAGVWDDALVVNIFNTGKWVRPLGEENGMGTGTGLENVRQRLKHVFPDRHRLDIGQENGFVRARLEIASDAARTAPGEERAS
jgi:two-component system LytT family sensor kinase